MDDVGTEMPGTGVRPPKRGAWNHQRGARKLGLAGFCYRFSTKNGDALVMRIWGNFPDLKGAFKLLTASIGVR